MHSEKPTQENSTKEYKFYIEKLAKNNYDLYKFKRKDTSKLKKILIAFVMSTFFILAAHAAPDANPTVRVGLYYNSNALPSANLQNIDGLGYRLGFFDSTHNFISQFSISGTNRISMLKDTNMYYYDGVFYESGQPSGSKFIGAYHLQLDTLYSTPEEVNAMTTSLKMQGIPAFVAISNNTYRIRIGSYASLTDAQFDAIKYLSIGTTTVVGASAQCITVVDTSNGTILFEYDNKTSLGVYPSLGEVPMPLTWFKGYKYHGGFQYIRDTGNISVINFVPMQQYVMGVIPYEMSPKWPIEALKAQAMCARTYALYNYGKHGKNFDVCATTDCQVYSGAGSASDNSNRAVEETYGTYILYDGKPINAVFHSSDGGATENSENVWSAALPYLRGVYDPNEDLDSSINGRWSYDYTPQELTYILNAKGYECGLIADMYVKEFTAMGNVKTLTLVDINGKVMNFSKEKARTILYSSTYKKYTHSQRYTVTKTGAGSDNSQKLYINGGGSLDLKYDTMFAIGKDRIISRLDGENVSIITASGKNTLGNSSSTPTESGPTVFRVSGTGWGHNVGMSQNGAKALAQAGKTAEEIINFYYTDVDIYKATY